MGGSNFEAVPSEWVPLKASVLEDLSDDNLTKEWEPVAATATTVVMVGKTGNGKSATGNSILGSKDFKSRRSLSSVTASCQLESVVTEDGRRVNVVDTPGLFDSSFPPDKLVSEISRCIELARDGIHALILVLSTRNRYTTEEMAAVSTLQTIFGVNVMNYMIIVFTGGDELEEDGLTIESCVKHAAPPLQDLMDRCQNRIMAFDNKSKDERKLKDQTAELLRMVDNLVAQNGGEPYTNAIFKEAQDLAASLAKEEELARFTKSGTMKESEEKQSWREELQEANANQLMNFNIMVQDKLRVAAEEQKRDWEAGLAAERTAREGIEADARRAAAQAEGEMEKLRANAEGEMAKLREELRHSQQSANEMRERIEREVGNKGCMIL